MRAPILSLAVVAALVAGLAGRGHTQEWPVFDVPRLEHATIDADPEEWGAALGLRIDQPSWWLRPMRAF